MQGTKTLTSRLRKGQFAKVKESRWVSEEKYEKTHSEIGKLGNFGIDLTQY
jgi:hypothetical protein